MHLDLVLSLSWKSPLVLFFAITYIFWICFLAFAGVKAAKDAGRTIPKVAMALASPFIVAAFVLDVVYNLTFGSLLFAEVPRTWTLTARASSHLKEDGYRGRVARWLCSNLLDPFQTGGHCHAIAALAVVFVFLLAAAPAFAQDVQDRGLTPGVTVPGLTAEKICKTKWGKDARHVTEAMKKQVFESYGYTGNDDPKCSPAKGSKQRCEIDHLISRELGGADDVKNLWPQPYGTKPWNAHLKDKLENRLHKEMCAGNITLEQAQHAIADDWRVPYRKYYGEPK